MRNNDAHHPKESRTEVSPSFPAVWLGAMGAEGGGPIRIGKHPPEPVAPGKERKGLLEAVKKFRNEQKHLAQRRRGAESTKKIKQLFISNLCASASLREIVNFFTRSRQETVSQESGNDVNAPGYPGSSRPPFPPLISALPPAVSGSCPPAALRIRSDYLSSPSSRRSCLWGRGPGSRRP